MKDSCQRNKNISKLFKVVATINADILGWNF